MKAVRLYEYGGPENLGFEVDVPEPTLSAALVQKGGSGKIILVTSS
jgi:hypothetical protein